MQPPREQLQIELGRDADRTVHRVGDRRDRRHGLRGARLRDGGLQRVGQRVFSAEPQRRRHARGRDLFRHHRELLLDRLELRERLAELPAVGGVRERDREHVVHRAGDPRSHQHRAAREPVVIPRDTHRRARQRTPAQVRDDRTSSQRRARIRRDHRQQHGLVLERREDPVGGRSIRHAPAFDRTVRQDRRARRDRDEALGRRRVHGAHEHRRVER